MVDSAEMLDKLLEAVSIDQESFSKFTQEQVDLIFTKCSMAANQARVKLAKMAVDEGGMGVLEDKTIKNHFAAEFVHNTYKNAKTCGIVENDKAGGVAKYAEPIGVLAGIVPCTNPTSTTVFKSLLALKTRNCIVFSPHPRTAKCTIAAAKLIRDTAVEFGAPANCIGWIDVPSVALCNELMRHDRVVMVVATGAGGLVKAAYSSGKPALGGGAGNTPVIIDETADIEMAVNSILLSKTFDNGMICASEQGVIVVESIANSVRREFLKRGAYFLDVHEKELVGNFILNDKGTLNPVAVGQPAARVAELAGVTGHYVGCRLLLAEIPEIGPSEPLSHEKLCPCLGFFIVKDFDEALVRALELVKYGGMGHTSVLYTDLNGPQKQARISKFQNTMPTGRTLICMPTSQGAIGNVFNSKQIPSLSLGCGSWGGNATAESLQVKHLLNYKEICERREHSLWFKVPQSIYFNRSSVTQAFQELKDDGIRRVFIVTDQGLKQLGYVNRVADELKRIGMDVDIFGEALPDPDVTTIATAVARMKHFNPDCIIALGGGSPMSSAKVIRLLYEHPETSLDSLHTRFMDAQKRIVKFPKLGHLIKKLVCIPTTSGTGSETTPFAVVFDRSKKRVYSIADYSFTPNMAIVDADFVLTMPARKAAEGAFQTLVHALESYVSMLATDYTQGLALRAIRLIFKNSVASVNHGDAKAREACHNACTIAGMSFANAFVGVCGSMANQLTAGFGIPLGVASAMLICQTIKFNASDAPSKQGTFAQYCTPKAKEQYAEVAESLGCALDADLDAKVTYLVDKITQLKTDLGVPASFKEHGISEDIFMGRVDEMALCAFDDQCTGANPRYPLITELRQLLIDAYYGTVRNLELAVVHDLRARQNSLDLKLHPASNN